MALELLAAAGPGINDIKMYDVADQGTNGYSLVTTPTPAQGNYRIKQLGSAVPLTVNLSEDLYGFAVKTYQWACLRTFRLDGTLTVGQQYKLLDLGTGIEIWWRYVSASTYNMGISRNGAVARVYGSTVFNTGTDYAIRAQATNGGMELWVDGASEASASGVGEARATNMRPSLNYMGTNTTAYWENILVCQSDDESDRPGTDVWIDIITPNGDTGGAYDGYGSDVSCGDFDTGGTYTKWNDYAAGGTPDDSEYNCEYASDEDAQVSSLTTVSPSGTTLGVIWRGRGRAFLPSKIVQASALLLDSDGTPNEVSVWFDSNLLDTTWRSMTAVFAVEPGGSGVWDIPNLQAGVRSFIGNETRDMWSALALEVVGVDSDPPAGTPAADRRRLAQVV